MVKSIKLIFIEIDFILWQSCQNMLATMMVMIARPNFIHKTVILIKECR